MQPAVRWRHVEARSSCLNGKLGHGRARYEWLSGCSVTSEAK